MSVPIVTYHSVSASGSPLSTTPEEFEAHLQAFAASGYRTVPLAELLGWLSRGRRPPADTMVITFDDGYQNVHRDAWPRLKAWNFTASVFLVSDHCGGTSRWPGQPESVPASPLMDWDEVQALAGDGWEFGAHTRTHPPLTTLTPGAIEDQVAGSQDAIRRRTGQEVTAFAYPYGAVNAGVSDIVRRHFAGAVTTRLGVVSGGCDPYYLPRIDAYYLRPRHVPHLRTPLFRSYLTARQAARSARRLFRQDWETGRTPA